MIDYNATVIQRIEQTAIDYIASNKRMPQTIRVGHYEYIEYRKALQNGVKPIVNFKGKQVTPNVIEEGGSAAVYDFETMTPTKGRNYVQKTETQA